MSVFVAYTILTCQPLLEFYTHIFTCEMTRKWVKCWLVLMENWEFKMFWSSVWNKWKPRWARVFSLDSFTSSVFAETWRFWKAPHFPRKIRRFQKGIRIGYLVLWTCQHHLTEKQMVQSKKTEPRSSEHFKTKILCQRFFNSYYSL